MRLTSLLLLSALVAAAQQPPSATSDNGGMATFSSSTQLVIETVNVRDKNGKPIENLTQKDFTVTENGVPQNIRLFEFQKLPEIPDAALIDDGSTQRPASFSRLTKTQIAPEAPGSPRYSDHRLLALYFDMTAMPPTDQLRALDAAERFVRTQFTAADLMAIMRFTGGAVEVVTDFTSDRERLLRVLETMIVGEAQGFDENPNDDSTADSGTAFGQDDSEFNIFNTDRQLSALQTAAAMLGQLSEKKSLLYFASGIRLNGVDNQAQLHATVNAAIRAGVTFWPIDARGLVAQAPIGDATQGSPGGAGMYNGASAQAFSANFQQSQDTLFALARDTGGKAFLDNNDLSAGIVQAQKSISSYYILGYYTSNAALDGKFRRIKISLNNGVAATLDYRQGYFSGKHFNKFTSADKERQLEDALLLGDPITELTIAMEVDFFQLNRAEYFVPITVKIPGRELALARRGGAEHTRIDFVGEIKDDFGTTVTNVRDKVDIKLTGETASALAKRPIEYDAGFTLLPGKYVIKFLARDDETGRIGTYQSAFVIPNLNKEEKGIPISSVILSSQRIEMKDALFNAKDKEKAESVNPLNEEGQKLIPSVTRVFSRSRDMYVYLQAYERGAETTTPLIAFVTFYRGSVKAFETPPLPVLDGLNAKSKAVPLKFSLPLNKIAPGEYICQVTILNPADQKAAFWQAQVVLIP